MHIKMIIRVNVHASVDQRIRNSPSRVIARSTGKCCYHDHGKVSCMKSYNGIYMKSYKIS